MTSTQGLLLIADIGGYTTYMSTHRMSLAHAEVNTGRLLGVIADAVPGLELVGIDVILLHRLLKNDVPLREYVLMTEDLYGTGSAGLPPSVGRVDPEVDGFGTVTAFYVDVSELDPGADDLPAPTWRGRLSRTVYAAGAGLPYMLGRRGRGRTTAAVG